MRSSFRNFVQRNQTKNLSDMKRILITVCMTFMLSCGAALAQVANYDVVPLPKSINQTNAPGFVLGEQVAVLYTEGNAEMDAMPTS